MLQMYCTDRIILPGVPGTGRTVPTTRRLFECYCDRRMQIDGSRNNRPTVLPSVKKVTCIPYLARTVGPTIIAYEIYAVEIVL